MNVDIRLQVGYLRHPKIVRLRARLGDAAVLALLETWLFATQHASPDGVLGLDPREVETLTGWAGESGVLVAELVTLGLLDETPYGLSVHNWALHNTWQAGEKARQERAKAAADARWSKDSNAQEMPKQMLEHMPQQMLADSLSSASANAQAMPRTVPYQKKEGAAVDVDGPPRGRATKAKSHDGKKEPAGFSLVVDTWFETFERVTGSKPTWGNREGGNLKTLLTKHDAAELVRRIGIFEQHHRLTSPSFGAEVFVWSSFVTHIDRWAAPPAGARPAGGVTVAGTHVPDPWGACPSCPADDFRECSCGLMQHRLVEEARDKDTAGRARWAARHSEEAAP